MIRNLIGISCLLALAAAATAAYAEDAAPAISSVTFHAVPAREGTYERGERVQVEVRFDRAVMATGSPRVALSVGTETRYATFDSWGGQSLYFDYIVQERDRDEDGISIAANALSLDGGTIRAADGTAAADLTHDAVAASSGQKVNGSLASPPAVTSIGFLSPATGDTFELGETIGLLVEFHRAVTVSGSPLLALTIGTQTRHAAYSTSWRDGRVLQFSYTVQEGDRDEDGIGIPANGLTTGGGTIRAADGAVDADLTLPAATPWHGVKVDGSLSGGTITAADGVTEAVLTHEAMAPAGVGKVSSSRGHAGAAVAAGCGRSGFAYSPARGDTYELGETVEVEVEFDRAVEATGDPQVMLTVGTQTRYANFSGWGSETLYFEYTVQAGDRDENGIGIVADALVLNGGTITAVDGTTDADLSHDALAGGSSRMVDGSLTTPPGVREIYFVSSPARGDTYELGETIELFVEFDRVVAVTGSPRVALAIGAQTRYAAYSAWSEEDRYLHFSYAVQESDRDERGIRIVANALELNGGTITAVAGTTDADLTHPAVAGVPVLKVHGGLVSAPALSAIYLDNHVPPPTGDTYVLGETVRVWVEFDKEITVTGRPQVALTIGSETRQAHYSGFSVAVTPDGGTIVDKDVLSFDYRVQATDRDEDGVGIPANALALNGGTIKHAGDGTTDAGLTHDAVPADPTRKVDGSRPHRSRIPSDQQPPGSCGRRSRGA